MAKRHAFVLTLLLLVALINSATAWTFHPKMHIHMINNLWPGTPLNLHCKSADDDLGWKEVRYNEEYNWTFTDNFIRSTMFWCNLNWLGGDRKRRWQSFEVYSKSVKCDKNCFWSSRGDGIYFFDYQKQDYFRLFEWNYV
ncbi:hypothetical protein Syun_011654 [Stephania yunnanensis]|uniref:S-protein homolog n=1 Tax=Stephania yunnanensis TaxID=152371 RepID=A0AAP0PGQ0_9MAGN